ncbi:MULTISPECIES: sporulation protein YpjB [unclassified Virgibacillus]|uniref:sporulation protein YpjB n=1 Tax=unclassified Virgibacillus TaxID=2620237 RepID=UPI0024DE0A9D|nr:sporulation protein YpjB [Virgibacillus sp. LDC-1]
MLKKQLNKITSLSWFIIGIFTIVISENKLYAQSIEEDTKESSGMIPLFWIIIIVGGCIALTLSYVSWRKYKGEKNKQKQDQIVD